MIVANRKNRSRVVRAGLPGLCHFSRTEPLWITINANITRIKMFLPHPGMISLAGIKIEREGKIVECALSGRASSVSRPSCSDPACLLKSEEFETAVDAAPWIELIFDEPVFLTTVRIFNRSDAWASRNYDLCVEWQQSDGAEVEYDNVGSRALRDRLAVVRNEIRQLYHRVFPPGAGGPKLEELSKIIYRLMTLADLVESEIDQPEADCEKIRNLRISIVCEIHSFVKRLDHEEQRRFGVNWRLLEKLLWKGHPENKNEIIEDHAWLVGLIIAAKYTQLGIVTYDDLTEFHSYLPNRRQMLSVQSEACSFANFWRDGRKQNSGFILGKHGFVPPKLVLAEQRYKESLFDVLDIMSKNKYQACICYGTLLGALREKTFIPHDDDVDILVLVTPSGSVDCRHEMSAIMHKLQQTEVKCVLDADFDVLKVWSPKGGHMIDVFPAVKTDNDHLSMYMQGMQLQDVPKDLITPFCDLTFYGEVINAPHKPDEFMRLRYGEDWMTPNQFAEFYWIRE